MIVKLNNVNEATGSNYPGIARDEHVFTAVHDKATTTPPPPPI